jgi:hypothetical protein
MKLKDVVLFLLHQFVSTIVILMLSTILTGTVVPVQRARWILTETPFYPVQILIAFSVGFAMAHYCRHGVMQWVWIFPALVLTVSFIRMGGSFLARLEHYFGWACRPELRCFDQLGMTLPFYTSAAYSFGAFLSRHFKGSARANEIRKPTEVI